MSLFSLSKVIHLDEVDVELMSDLLTALLVAIVVGLCRHDHLQHWWFHGEFDLIGDQHPKTLWYANHEQSLLVEF